MQGQEQIITPIQEYKPVSALEPNDRKRVENPDVLLSVTSFSSEAPRDDMAAAQAQLAFLRRVEQVRKLQTGLIPGPLCLDLGLITARGDTPA